MTVFVSIFGGSLLLASGFFAFKDWERQRGRATGLTSFFNSYSPKAEMLFRTTLSRVAFVATASAVTVSAFVRFGFHRALTFVRAGVVVVAAHMIRVVRGERLVAEGAIPSTYFKLLHRHKEKINGTDIPDGIARPDVLRKVKIHTADSDDSAEVQPQVK